MRQFLVALVVVLGVVSCGMGPDTVAEVGDLKITQEEYKDVLSRRFPKLKEFTTVDMKEKRVVLNQLINGVLKINAALDAGLDEDPEINYKYNRRRMRISTDRLFERLIMDSLVPEEKIREAFNKRKEQLKVSHILIGFNGSEVKNEGRDGRQAYKLAYEIAQKARKGQSFEKLAVKYSDDPSAKTNKGLLGFFTWGDMVPAFQEAAYKLKEGEVSDPVLTRYGYHVILLHKRRPNKGWKESLYEAQKREIKRSLFRNYNEAGMKRWKAIVEKEKKEYHYKRINSAIEKFNAIARELDKGPGLAPENFSADQKEIVLVRWDGGSLKSEELILAYGNKMERYKNGLLNLARLTKEVDGRGEAKLVGDMAVRLGIDKEPDLARNLRLYRESLLARKIEDIEVKSKIVLNDDSLRAYYDRHPSEFQLPEEIEIYHIYCESEAAAKKVYRKARGGADFKKLAEKYSDDKFYAKRGGYAGFKTKNGMKGISEIAFEHGPNQIIPPVPYREGWAVIKTGPKKEKVLRSFEDAYNQIRVKYKQLRLRKLREAWNKELKEKYTVRINEELLEKI